MCEKSAWQPEEKWLHAFSARGSRRGLVPVSERLVVLRCNGGHTALQSNDNPAVCIKGFVLAGPATECPRVMTLFIFPLS